MDNIQNIYIDLLNNRNNQYIYTKQNDKGRRIVFRFTRNGKLIDISDATVRFVLRKSDGSIFSTTLTTTDTTALLTLTEDITSDVGLQPYQITFTDNNASITTVTSYMLCEEDNSE